MPTSSRPKRSRSGRDPHGDGGGTGGLTLTVESGTHAGKRVTLKEAGSIGRSSKCELCLRGAPGVSRRHARLERRGDHFVVFDTESRNGIVLNGVEIAGEAAVSDGDLLELSDEKIRISFAPDDFDPVPTEALPHQGSLAQVSTDDVDTRPAPRARGPRASDTQQRPLGLESAAALLADVEEPYPLDKKKPPPPPAATQPPTLPPQAQLPHPAAEQSMPEAPVPGAPPMLSAGELEPLGMPSEEPAPVGVPDQAGPYLGDPPPPPSPQTPSPDLGPSPNDSAFPTAAADAPRVPQPPPPRRGSVLMFLVGGLVGLILALLVVLVGDHFLNAGKLRSSAADRLNLLLEPYDVQLPSLAELTGAGGTGVATTDGGAQASTDAGTGQADAGADKASAAAPTEPVILKAPKALMVVKVEVKAGDPVDADAPLLGVMMGDKRLLQKKLKLEKESRALRKKASKRRRRGKRAKRQLAKVSAELNKLLTRLEATKLKAPTGGVIDKVHASGGDIVDEGAPLVTVQPAEAQE